MSKIDVMIQITLGLDLNEEKAKIINQNGVYLFVADKDLVIVVLTLRKNSESGVVVTVLAII